MASGGTQEDGDIGFQIAPMVDVVFVLLLFFMAVAGSQTTSRELTTRIPAEGRGMGVTPFVIEISAQGTISSGGKLYDDGNTRNLTELKAQLESNILRFGDRDPVIIRPSPQTRHERVIDVLNAAAAAGVKNLTFS